MCNSCSETFEDGKGTSGLAVKNWQQKNKVEEFEVQVEKKSVGPLECLPSEDKNLSGNFIGKLIHFRIIIYASSFSRAFFYIKIPIFFSLLSFSNFNVWLVSASTIN